MLTFSFYLFGFYIEIFKAVLTLCRSLSCLGVDCILGVSKIDYSLYMSIFMCFLNRSPIMSCFGESGSSSYFGFIAVRL